MGGGPANESWACHVGLTAGEGVTGDNVVPRWSAPRVAALRSAPAPVHPQPTGLGCSAGPTMFSRKKRELMKTPSISKKNRAGSPSPQPSGVSEPLGEVERVGTLEQQGDRGTPSAPAAGQGLGGNMWRGSRASYSPHQVGLQRPDRTGGAPGIQLMVGPLWDSQCLSCPVQGPP